MRCGRLKFLKKRLTSQNRYDITIERPIEAEEVRNSIRLVKFVTH